MNHQEFQDARYDSAFASAEEGGVIHDPIPQPVSRIDKIMSVLLAIVIGIAGALAIIQWSVEK